MMSVVAPQHDRGVVRERRPVERVEHLADLSVDEADAGQIGLDEELDRGNVRRILGGPGHMVAECVEDIRRDVVRIVRSDTVQDDVIQRIEVEIFLRDDPVDMGLGKPDRQHERSVFGPILRQEPRDVVGADLVPQLVGAGIWPYRASVGRDVQGVVAHVLVVVEHHLVGCLRRPGMPELADPDRLVAGGVHDAEQGFGGIHGRFPVRLVVEDIGFHRRLARQDGDPGGIADGDLREGVGEDRAGVRQPVEVRRMDGSRIALQGVGPVFQIIDGDEQKVLHGDTPPLAAPAAHASHAGRTARPDPRVPVAGRPQRP